MQHPRLHWLLLVLATAASSVPGAWSQQVAATPRLWVVDPWTVPAQSDGRHYPLLTVCEGDQIRFVWQQGMHGVFRLFSNVSGPDGNCSQTWNASQGVVLHPVASSGNFTYVSKKEAGPFWLACQFDKHCQRGMRVQVFYACPSPAAGLSAAGAPPDDTQQVITVTTAEEAPQAQSLPLAADGNVGADDGPGHSVLHSAAVTGG